MARGIANLGKCSLASQGMDLVGLVPGTSVEVYHEHERP